MAGKRKKSNKTASTCDKKGKFVKDDSPCKILIADEDHVARLQKELRLPMPKDFFDVWNWCLKKSPESPSDALDKCLGVRLTGPYDVLGGKVSKDLRTEQLHGRYFYDPPEFTTVIESSASDNAYHIGYYRDTPASLPCLVAGNDANNGYVFDILGDNLFAALMNILRDMKRNPNLDKNDLDSLETDLVSMSSHRELNFDKEPASIKARKKSVVASAFHGLGITVPLDENEVGYRPLPKPDAHMKRMLQRIIDSKSGEDRSLHFEQLREIMTLVKFANDECDYGMGYELGIDLFSIGSDLFHKSCERLLCLAYDLLEMSEFSGILQAHLEERQRPSITCYI